MTTVSASLVDWVAEAESIAFDVVGEAVVALGASILNSLDINPSHVPRWHESGRRRLRPGQDAFDLDGLSHDGAEPESSGAVATPGLDSAVGANRSPLVRPR